ncbi:hypothetical protein [Sulfurimonas microaerophilic]|uniref:hypothetical protein n=1 Tax=Sulfurimonas microaerophilic TaxID=3058392 RepID=UPI0027152F3D|nr:hypothetical protein [Sulfurimonas sp. hsl 1-7]
MSRIFEDNEIEGKTGTELQQATQQIKQRFDQKRGYYHNLRNQQTFFENWNELNQRIIDFDTKYFTPWNQQWATIQRTNNPQSILTSFQNALVFFNDMDEFILSISNTNQNSEEIESLKTEILQHVERDILDLKANISSEIERGINNLVGLKAELGLQKNFKDNIDTELKTSMKFRFRFMSGFMITLFLLPMLVLSTYYFDIFKNINTTELYVLRIGITISLAFFSYFLYSQYKLYQIICLRYSHLQGFLGGGATFIGQIIGSENSELKQDINKKLAELFMELEHVFGVAKKSSHPAEISIEKTGELLDKIANITNASPKA